jgi:succinoglycan biosynthesis transport protein ExoP
MKPSLLSYVPTPARTQAGNEPLVRAKPSLLDYADAPRASYEDVPHASYTEPPHAGYADAPLDSMSADSGPIEMPFPDEEPVTPDRIASFMELDLRRIFVWLNSGRKLTLALTVALAVAAVAWGQFATRSYTVTTDILIDPNNLQVGIGDPLASSRDTNTPLLSFGSKTRILTSANVMRRAIQELDLAADPEFFNPSPNPFSLSRSKPQAKPDPETAALMALQKKVSIETDEKSFIASLSVSAQNATKAMEISRALVDAFQVELAAGDAEKAARTARALDERLGDLKRAALEADARVEEYKRANNLSTGEKGELVSAQTLSRLNTDIITARARVINAQTSYDELLKVGDASLGGQASVSLALTSLLQTAGIVQQEYDDQAAILGARHPSIIRLQARLSSIQQQVRTELERAKSAAKTELDKANAALAELTSKMRSIEDSTFDENESQIELRELQRDAAAKAAIYESFISRSRQLMEGEQINTNDIRVISEALPPSGRSWPPSSLVLLFLGGFVGLLLGIGTSVVRGIVTDMRSAPTTVHARYFNG